MDNMSSYMLDRMNKLLLKYHESHHTEEAGILCLHSSIVHSCCCCISSRILERIDALPGNLLVLLVLPFPAVVCIIFF